MKEDIKTIGDNLKQKRKEMNLSLKEAENATSIRSAYLQAIEEGTIQQNIPSVYAQGFLRQYAIYLGLDGEQIIRDNSDLFSRNARQEFDYGIGTLEMRGNPGSGVKGVPNVVWLAGFGAVFILAWYFARYLEVL